MTSGLYQSYKSIIFRLNGSYATSSTSTANGVASSGALVTYYTTPGGLIPFVEINQSNSIAISTGIQSAKNAITCSPLGITEQVTYTSVRSSMSSSMEVFGYACYVVSGLWETSWTSIQITLDGNVYTFGAGSISGLLQPSGLPFLGVPPTISASGSLAVIPTPSVPTGSTPGSSLWSGTASVSGGYGVIEVGSLGGYAGLPCNVTTYSGFNTCSCAPNGQGTVGAGDTLNGSATGGVTLTDNTVYRGRFVCNCPSDEITVLPSIDDVYDREVDYNIYSAQITLIPGLPKSVKRFGQDYKALILRGGIPATTADFGAACQDVAAGTGIVSTTNIYPVTPSYTSLLATVSNGAHVIEQPFANTTQCMYAVNGIRVHNKGTTIITIQQGECVAGTTGTGGGGTPGPPPGPPSPCFQQYAIACQGSTTSGYGTVEDISANPYLITGYYTNDFRSRFMDYVANPHWSYCYFFPNDVTSGPVQSYEWPKDSMHAPPSQYWLPAKTQQLLNPALPAGENLKSLTDLISAPLASGGLAPYFASIFGNNNLCPWGINRFKAQAITLPTSITLTQSQTAQWAFTNGTASFGVSAITITPTGSPATVTAKLTLVGFGNDPRQILAFIQQFVLNWSGSGISSTAVNVIGLDSIIASVATSPGTYDWPSGVVDSEYGGSWARDFSVGFSITDMGTDVPVGGISTTLMTSAQNAFDYQFLAGSEAVYLEFIFSLSDPSKTITLNYPEFLTPTDPGIIIPETPTTSILVFPNGPGVRYGTMSYWNYIMNSFSDPPLVDAFGQMPTVLDWLCWKRIALEGIAATSGLDTEIANLYTSTEGNTRAALSVGTESFVVMASPSSDGTVNNAITGILVNTYAEAPPICQTPLKARDKSFQPTGAYAQEAWSHAQWGRYYVSIPKADIADPSGTIVSSPWIPGVPGWPIQRQAIPSNGSENLSTWTIVSHGEVFADFNPWHGTFSILFPGGAERYPWLLCTDEGEMHNAYCKLNDSGTFDIWYRWSSLNVPKWNHDKRVTFTGGWSWPKMARDYTTRIYLTATYTNQGGSDPLSSGVYQIYSDDEGQTWSPQSGGVLAPVFLG